MFSGKALDSASVCERLGREFMPLPQQRYTLEAARDLADSSALCLTLTALDESAPEGDLRPCTQPLPTADATRCDDHAREAAEIEEGEGTHTLVSIRDATLNLGVLGRVIKLSHGLRRLTQTMPRPSTSPHPWHPAPNLNLTN